VEDSSKVDEWALWVGGADLFFGDPLAGVSEHVEEAPVVGELLLDRMGGVARVLGEPGDLAEVGLGPLAVARHLAGVELGEGAAAGGIFELGARGEAEAFAVVEGGDELLDALADQAIPGCALAVAWLGAVREAGAVVLEVGEDPGVPPGDVADGAARLEAVADEVGALVGLAGVGEAGGDPLGLGGLVLGDEEIVGERHLALLFAVA
jgi:hypothetical protein